MTCLLFCFEKWGVKISISWFIFNHVFLSIKWGVIYVVSLTCGAIKPNYIDLAKSSVQIYLSFGIVQILFENTNTIVYIYHDCMTQF